MRSIRAVKSLRKILKEYKNKNKTIGFIPTMGALHEGHLSLMRKSRQENDIVVVSIFVNPKQFGPEEDFTQYPRDEKKDKLLARKEKIDIIFYPSVEEVYPKGFMTFVDVEDLSNALCGQFRPGHFRGVTTVMSKLLNIVTPDVLYLGQKDAQQAVIIKKMVRDLNLPVHVKICATAREKDGLAWSSRNRYLTKNQRQEAPVLFESLKAAKRLILNGERNASKVIQKMQTQINKQSSAEIEYIVCVNTETLKSLARIQNEVMIALSIKFGKTRLIDNIVFNSIGKHKTFPAA